MRSPNRLLQNRTPLADLRQGEYGSVLTAVDAYLDGTYV